MFGCHVMNQSVENGSIPFGGDTPFSSLYSLIRRSRDRLVSASSSCRRAPSSISSMARVISFTSITTLLLAMVNNCPLDVVRMSGQYAGRRRGAPGRTQGKKGSADAFDRLAGHQDGRVRVRDDVAATL